jgi:hypothetical protein
MTKAAPLVLLCIALLLTSCETSQDRWLVPSRVDVLRHNRDWPRVQSLARCEIEQQKRDPEFAWDAYYRPIAHTNGVWFITVTGVMYYQNHYSSFIEGAGVSGGYPHSESWDAYDLRIGDKGKVLSYAARRETQYDAGWVYP